MPNAKSAAQLRESLDLAFRFGQKIGIATYDPFDTKGSKLGMWLYATETGPRRILRKAYNAADLLAPLTLRKLLRLPKKPSHGGVARWAQANLAYARLTQETRYKARAFELLEWLSDHPADAPVGKGWGLPFDWQAFVAVPANTAIGHTTMSVLNAMLDGLAQDAPRQFLKDLDQGAHFLAAGLNQTTRSSGSIALSYTPLDSSQVINTNAEIAALLAKTARILNQPGHLQLAEKLALFTVETQNPDHSWFYSAPDAGEGRQVVDHYHTGMILTALMDLTLEITTPELHQKLTHSLNNGLAFHLLHHFDKEGCPKMRPDTPYPIDSYSAGESLLTLTHVLTHPHIKPELKTEAKTTLANLASYVTSSKMMAPDGCFVYRIWPQKTMRLESLRWAQALVCHGLAEYLLHIQTHPEDNP